MCFRALQRIRGKNPDEPILDGSYMIMTREAYIELSKEEGLVIFPERVPLDATYRIATKANLDKIALFLVYPAEWYIADLWDCNSYGLQAQLDAGRKYQTTVRLGLGMLDNDDIGIHEYHGFATAKDIDGNRWLLEPNAGFPWSGKWFRNGEYGYSLDKEFV